MSDVKQVILMRNDLNMRKGKMCAQASHASLGVVTNKMSIDYGSSSQYITAKTFFYEKGGPFDLWLNGTFTKICLKVSSEEELVSLYNKAVEEGIPSCLITDSGKTEFNGVSTKTCCAIGPHWSEEIDKVTGHLSLL